MFYEIFEKKWFNFKPYNTYSNEKKIDIHLTLHSVFNIQLKATENILEVRDLDKLEGELLRLVQLDLIEDIYKCENEINKLNEDITDPDILEKIEVAGIDGTMYKITGHENISIKNFEYIKGLLLLNELYVLQMESLKGRKSIPYISECEKKVLSEILNLLSSSIINNYQKVESIHLCKIPIDFKYRREIKDAIDDSKIETFKALYPQRSHITVDYLKTEVLDLRKWEPDKWFKRRYDLFLASYDPYNFAYVFNFQALMNGFDRYSLKKQIEVGIAIYCSIQIQLKALYMELNNKKELTEYQKIIWDYRIRTLFSNKIYYDVFIAKTFLIESKKKHFYEENILNRLEKKVSKNIKLEKYHIENDQSVTLSMEPSYCELVTENKERLEEAEIAYNNKYNSLCCSIKSDPVDGNRTYIHSFDLYDSNRAELIKFLIAKHELETLEIEALLQYNKTLKKSGYENKYDNIFIESLCAYKTSCVLLTDEEIWDAYYMLPDDYPDREKIFNSIKKAKVDLDPKEIKNE